MARTARTLRVRLWAFCINLREKQPYESGGEPAGLRPFDFAQGRLWPGQPRRLSLREFLDRHRNISRATLLPAESKGVESASGLRILGIPELEMLMAELDDPAAEAQSRPNPNEKLVKIFDSETETEALVVKGLLDSANIENSLGPVSLSQYAFPDVGGTVILVKGEDADAARQLIEDYRRPTPAADDETAEIDINTGEPRVKG
jgi:hypothetical protein